MTLDFCHLTPKEAADSGKFYDELRAVPSNLAHFYLYRLCRRSKIYILARKLCSAIATDFQKNWQWCKFNSSATQLLTIYKFFFIYLP